MHDESESTIFTIEGRLTAQVAPELEGIWQAATVRQPTKSIVVRLASVSFVDSEAKLLLARMRRQGVKLVPTGCLMHMIVQQIEAEMPQSVCGV
jgi:anti-anti-sigma regulatory factor